MARSSSAAAASPAASAAARPRAAWIDSSWRDLVLYVATPLLLVPLILLRPGRPAIQDLILYVGAFGALGHHLPGMMRAYGDRALFQRFRVRFLLAPLFLGAVCVYFTLHDLGGVILVTFFWTTWHTLMQIFGFARIYDAKVGNTSRATSRLDHALCLAWIGAPILLNDSRLGSVLELWYASGAPLLSAGAIGGVRDAWLVGTIAVSLGWLLHTALVWKRGQPPNLVKLLLFASSFGFWWFCMATVDHLLVGVALFDIFHDVQYLALVWTFNKTRVASDPSVGRFSRALFRGRTALAGVYVGMVVAYGSIGYFSESISQDAVRKSLLGLLAASALLHFYFDGFIWKVRERSTRAALDLEGGGADSAPGGLLPAWAAHGSKWFLFVIPLGALYWWDVNDARPEREWRAAILEVVPDSAEALTNLGATLDAREDPEHVLGLHRRATLAKPTHPESHHNLGMALYLTGQFVEAEASFREAIRLLPDYGVAHRNLATLLAGRLASMRAGAPAVRPAEAAALFLETKGHYEAAIAADAEDAAAYSGLAALLHGGGETAKALESFEKALALDPHNRTALNSLAWIRATHPDAALRDGPSAVEHAEALADLTDREEPMVLDTLAAAYAETGRFDDALSTLAEALALARMQRRGDLAQALEQRLRVYERGEPLRSGR